jgi:hypothetical protein
MMPVSDHRGAPVASGRSDRRGRRRRHHGVNECRVFGVGAGAIDALRNGPALKDVVGAGFKSSMPAAVETHDSKSFSANKTGIRSWTS